MAKFERRKRIEFDAYDSKWKGSYLVVALVSFDVASSYDKDSRKLRRRVVELESIAEKTEEQFQELESLNDQFRTRMVTFIGNQVREGKIFDDEVNELVDLKPEDLGQFDFEVLNQLIEVILGKLSDKKK